MRFVVLSACVALVAVSNSCTDDSETCRDIACATAGGRATAGGGATAGGSATAGGVATAGGDTAGGATAGGATAGGLATAGGGATAGGATAGGATAGGATAGGATAGGATAGGATAGGATAGGATAGGVDTTARDGGPPMPPGSVGAPCMTVADCNDFGPGTICKTAPTYGPGTHPGGYCTRQPCDPPNHCPAGSFCSHAGYWAGENQRYCMNKCDPDVPGSCRQGYRCYPLPAAGPEGGVCYLSNPPDVRPSAANNTQATQTGNPCFANSQCRNPPVAPYDALAFCQQPLLPDGGSSGYVGGYCTAQCYIALLAADFRSNLCGEAASCVIVNRDSFGAPTLGLCFANCPEPDGGQSTCRSGYTCQPGGGDGGVCRPQ